jgi:hypothetical protein
MQKKLRENYDKNIKCNRDMNITYTDGRVTVVDTEDEAVEILESEYPDCYILDEWQKVNSRHERKLVWAAESDSENDDGANAIASIRREIARYGEDAA